jgi:hypothetical protein
MRKSIHHGFHELLGEILIKSSLDKALTQRELPEKIHTPASYSSKVETGERRLDVIEFYKYGKALDQNPLEVFVRIFLTKD